MLNEEKVMKLYTSHILKNKDRMRHMERKQAEQYMLGVVDFLNVILDELEKEERKE